MTPLSIQIGLKFYCSSLVGIFALAIQYPNSDAQAFHELPARYLQRVHGL